MSLGYGQPIADVDQDRLAHRGWGLVRRPTGGRAILHTDELTYSVTAPMEEPRVVGSVVESYRRLSQGLLSGLQRLGLSARADPKDPATTTRAPDGTPIVNPVCFEVPSDYEITADGRKLLGSAQVRKRGVVLQHGTLPLWGDITRILDGLAYADAERETLRARVRSRAATLAAIGLRQPDRAATFDHRSLRDAQARASDPTPNASWPKSTATRSGRPGCRGRRRLQAAG